MSAWPQPFRSSDWSKETWVFKEGAKPWDLSTHVLTSVEVHLQTRRHTHTHTHAAWTQRRMARRERAKRYLAFKRGAADNQAQSHLMPGHLPSVCWIIPLACSTTGTSLNTPVKYKNTQSKTRSHTHTERKKKGLQLQTAGRDMCLSGWVTGGGFSTSPRRQRRPWLIREQIFQTMD